MQNQYNQGGGYGGGGSFGNQGAGYAGGGSFGDPGNGYGGGGSFDNPMANQYNQNPMSNQYNQNPMANQYNQNPMANQYNQNPMANQYYQNPMANQYNQNPMANQYNQNPMMNQYNQSPMINQYNQNPMMNQYQEPSVGQEFSGSYMNCTIPHIHPIKAQTFSNNLRCDICGVSGNGTICYSCRTCDMDICQNCCGKILYAPLQNVHHHQLYLTKRNNWVCDNCKSRGKNLSMYCSKCDYDCCTNCYINGTRYNGSCFPQ